MKKLIAMIGAVAMSFGLFADAYTISFEGAESTKGVDTSSMLFTPVVSAAEWAWTGDPLPLTAYGTETKFAYGEGAFARRDSMFDGVTDNLNYLPLETGTDKLVRSMNGNIYLDQLVKFTGFEDPQTNLVDGTKIAIWMSEFENEDESTTTNLYVTVGKVTDDGVEQIALQIDGNYTLDTWYRLSIKSLGGIYTSAVSDSQRAGFLIYINGQQAKAIDEEAKSLTPYDGEMDGIAKGYMAEGQLFTAITAGDTFASVGYQGIGAIDDVIIDAEGPKFCQTVDVVIPTVVGAEVDYVDVNGTRMTPPISVPDGTQITVYFKPTEGMKLTGLDYVTQTITSDDYEIDVKDIVAEEVVATLTVVGEDPEELAQSELADALAALNEGDKIETVLACETDDYGFSADTTITGTATGLSIIVGTDGDSALEVAADIGEDETLTVIFEDEESGELTISSENVAGTLEANGTTVIGGTIALAEGATFKAAAIDFDTYYGMIALAEGASVMTMDNTLTEDELTLPEGDYKLDVSDEDAEGYYTYTAKAVVPPASGFMVILADGTELDPVDTLPEALALIDDGATIKLLADVTDAVGIVVDTKKSFTIDFDSHVYTVNKPGAGSPGTQTSAFQFIKGQTIVLKNGTIQAAADNLELATVGKNIKRFIQSYADLTLENMALNGANLYLNATDNAMCEFANGEVSIEGETSIIAGKENLDAISIDTWKGAYPNGVSVTIDTTGTISSVKVWTEGTGAFTAGEVVLEGGTINVLTVDDNSADYEIKKGDDATVPTPEGYKWENNVLKLIVATVASGVDTYTYTTAADALAAVQSLESNPENFPIVATALVADLQVTDPVTGAQIVLAKDETITITANSWVFSGGATITPGKSIALAAGATFTVTTKIDNYKALFTAPTGYEVTETYNETAGTYTYSAAQSAAKVVEIVGGDQYATLGEAIAALTGGETIKLLANYTATDAEANDLQFKASATLDLNKKTLTVPGTVMSAQKFGNAAGTEVTFTNGTILMPEEGGNCGITIYGTLNVACTIVRNGGHAPVFDVMDGATVNAGADADITSDAIIFWAKKAGDRTINITGGEYKGSQNTIGTDYDVFYASYPDGYAELNITGGEFAGKNGIIAALYDGLIDCSLDDTCEAKFSKVGVKTDAFHDVVGYIADGYEAVKGEDDWYTIQAIPTYTVAAITVENAAVVATNTVTEEGLTLPATVLRDTEIAVTVTPDTGYEYKTTPAGWTKNENGSITTNATVTADLAITVEAPAKAAADPVDPEVPTHYDTPQKAADAAKEINDNKATMIKTPDGADPADYTALFTAVVTADNDVVVELTEAGTNAVKEAATTIETAVADKLGDIAAATAGGSVEVTVTEGVKNGFWYGVAATAELTAMGAAEPAEWVQAKNGSVTIKATKPITGNAAFFQTRAKVK